MMERFVRKISVMSMCLVLLIGLFAGVGFVDSPRADSKVDLELDTDIPDIDVTPPTSGGDASGATGDEDKTEDESKTEDEVVETIPIPERFRSALQAYNYATKYLNSSVGVYSETSGFTTASVASQEIKGHKKIDANGDFLCESTSKKTGSIGVNFAEKCYIPKGESKIYYKETSSVNNDLTANYSSDAEVYTYQDYLAKYFVMPNERSYIINKSTIINSTIKYDRSTERYQGSFLLNSDAVEAYKYKIKKSSGSSSVPSFTSISMDFVLDKYGRFLVICTNEICTATVVINVTINTKVKEVFRSYDDSTVTIEEGEF